MHKVIDGPPAIGTAFSALDVRFQLPSSIPLVFAILHRQRLKSPLGVNALAIRIDQIALQPTHHHPGELGVTWEDVSREPLIIKEFEECGEGFGVAVVRRGGEKQLVLEVWRGQTNQPCPEAFDGIATDGRGDVVSLVDDQQVELPGMADVRGQCVPQKAQAFTLLGPVHRRDETGKRRPRILDAILWLARSGARWRDLPEDRFGPYQTVKRRYYRWIEQGVFDRIFAAVSSDPDMEWIAIDATVIRAQVQAAGARQKRGGRKPRLSDVHAAASEPKSTL
uniref:Transposase n=1 Tax=Magnetospirillum gryphiswaldense TaxID=55518 RepID=A4TYF7_9PROT|nr:transposase [Magnetospirillum gryphiswaldense MSR-1]